MLDFFKKVGYKKTNVILNVSDMRLVVDNIDDGIKKVKEYYRNHSIFINKNNMITNLIHFFERKVNLDFDTYYQHITNSLKYIYKLCNFVNINMSYSIHQNELFSNSLELFIPIEDDAFLISGNMMETSPIKITHLDYDRVELELYNGNLNLNGTLVIMEINITHLALMYHIYRNKLNGVSDAPYAFLNAYVYPAMLNNFINLVILNKIRRDYYNKKPSIMQNYVRYARIIDMNSRLDGVVKSYLKLFTNKSMSIDMYVDNTPTYKGHLSETLKNTNYFYDLSQFAWIKWYNIIPYARFYLDMMGELGRNYNRDKIMNMMYDFKALRNNNYNLWMRTTPKGLVDKLRIDIEYIKEKYIPKG